MPGGCLRLALAVVSAGWFVACSADSGAKRPAASPPAAVASTDAAAPTEEPAESSAAPVEPKAPASGEAVQGRPWLGVELGATEPEQPGVLVRGVIRGAPAEAAGLAAGDVILRLDGEPVSGPEDVVRLVGLRRPGERLSVAFTRAGADRLLAVPLSSMPVRDEMLRMHFIGAEAPSFEELKPVQGNVAPSLQSLRGKVVVVEFWASWCAACRMLVPVMNDWNARFTARGATILGITTDAVELAAATAGQIGMSYPIFSDLDGKTTSAYRAMALPMLFVIDQRGVVREVIVGYSTGGIAQVDAMVEKLLSAG